MASRHRSRELAVQLSYQWELDPSSLDDPKVIDRFWKEQALSAEDNRVFFEALVRGVATHLLEIDAVIKAHLDNWKMERLEKVDLALLRVAVYELLYYQGVDPADPAVVINEAVDIAKKFGSQKAGSFVNGILDAVAQSKGRLGPKKA